MFKRILLLTLLIFIGLNNTTFAQTVNLVFKKVIIKKQNQEEQVKNITAFLTSEIINQKTYIQIKYKGYENKSWIFEVINLQKTEEYNIFYCKLENTLTLITVWGDGDISVSFPETKEYVILTSRMK
jgi:hypothetical protein